MVEQRRRRGVFTDIDTRRRMPIERPDRVPGDLEALDGLTLYELPDFFASQVLPVVSFAQSGNQGVEIDPTRSVDL
jgi:hypothetical protein